MVHEQWGLELYWTVKRTSPHPCYPHAGCCCQQHGVGAICASLSSDSGISKIWGIPSSNTRKKPQFPTYKVWVWEVGETNREEEKDRSSARKIQWTKLVNYSPERCHSLCRSCFFPIHWTPLANGCQWGVQSWGSFGLLYLKSFVKCCLLQS